MVGENVTYHDPSFVTYKMRPEVVQASHQHRRLDHPLSQRAAV